MLFFCSVPGITRDTYHNVLLLLNLFKSQSVTVILLPRYVMYINLTFHSISFDYTLCEFRDSFSILPGLNELYVNYQLVINHRVFRATQKTSSLASPGFIICILESVYVSCGFSLFLPWTS
jgi:hypothetical protein